MKLHIRTSWMHKLDEAETASLVKELTVRQKSGIREILNVAPHNKLWAVIAYHKGHPVGWCVLECREVCYAQLYVKATHRGQGIGSKLLKRAKRMAARKGKRLMVAELDRSSGFFAKVAQKTKLFWHPLSPSEKPRLITT